jgi:hypothetical protein
MRAAPAVRVAVRPPTAARGAVALVGGLAAAAGSAWAAGQAQVEPAWSLLALLPGALVGWWQGPQAVHDLAWDGQQWHLDGQPCSLSVPFDLHSLLLLRCVPASGRPRWLLPHARAVGVHWHALRVAIFGGKPAPPTDPAGQPPLAP